MRILIIQYVTPAPARFKLAMFQFKREAHSHGLWESGAGFTRGLRVSFPLISKVLWDFNGKLTLMHLMQPPPKLEGTPESIQKCMKLGWSSVNSFLSMCARVKAFDWMT